MSYSRAYRYQKEQVKAYVFFAVLIACTLLAIILGFSSLDSIILGSELNGNGTVEYLCLGTGCDGLTRMDW